MRVRSGKGKADEAGENGGYQQQASADLGDANKAHTDDKNEGFRRARATGTPTWRQGECNSTMIKMTTKGTMAGKILATTTKTTTKNSCKGKVRLGQLEQQASSNVK